MKALHGIIQPGVACDSERAGRKRERERETARPRKEKRGMHSNITEFQGAHTRARRKARIYPIAFELKQSLGVRMDRLDGPGTPTPSVFPGLLEGVKSRKT